MLVSELELHTQIMTHNYYVHVTLYNYHWRALKECKL